MIRTFIILLTLMAFIVPAGAEEIGLYFKPLKAVQGGFDQAVASLESAISAGGMQVLASYDAGVGEDCVLRAHNIVIDSTDYNSKVMEHGPLAAFALPLRMGVYEDTEGISVSFVNPSSLNRTVMGDEVKTELSAAMADTLAGLITSALEGTAANEHLGQLRSKGYVGGMGGGKFLKKVEHVYTGEGYADVVDKVQKSIEADENQWQLRYRISPAGGVTLFGITKAATEAKAFGIASDKRKSKDNPCPGIDHVSAFPIEVLVFEEDGVVKVATLDEMYRMKVYFEDAGKWAFMKNMAMPGQIEDEVVEASTSLLK